MARWTAPGQERLVYVVEKPPRSRKTLRYSVMPADRPGGDVIVAVEAVPMQIRRLARKHFGMVKPIQRQ